MTELELEIKKARLLITYDMLGIKARAGARAGVKDEVKAEISRIEAEIAKLKEKTND
jgi:hypothetical protein